MKWPPDWLPDRLAHWRPEPLHIAALGGAAVVILSLVVGLAVASPWSDGDGDEEAVLETFTASPSATPRRSRSPSPSASPAPTVTPTPTPAAQPQTAQPTGAPRTQAPAPPAPARPAARLATLFSWPAGDKRVTDMAMIPGGGDEAFVLTQKDADVWRVSLSGAHPPLHVGDIGSVGGGGNEEGLLSIAFSPNFTSDGRVYVYYTRGSPQPTVLARFQVVSGAVDPGSQVVILEIPDFASNHNGGDIVFGRDGMLYLSTGDGGGGGDPNENGQNTSTLLGKVLRLNVTGQQTYSIPGDNPFVGGGGAPEVWAYGFRNPWRMTMDSATGEMWVGDVGQSAWEEVGRASRGGNHGWDCYEGVAVYESSGCPGSGFVQPRAVYPHSGGRCSVTGGYVYRGSAIPSLQGWYVYGDFCSGEIWAVNPGDGSAPVLLQDTPYSISSFAELPGGELAVLTFDGAVYRLAA